MLGNLKHLVPNFRRSLAVFLVSTVGILSAFSLAPITASAATNGIDVTGFTVSTSTMQNATVYTLTGTNLPILTGASNLGNSIFDYQNFILTVPGITWGNNSIYNDAYGLTLSVNTSTELQFTLYDGSAGAGYNPVQIYLSPANSNVAITNSDLVASDNFATGAIQTYPSYYSQNVSALANLLPGTLSLTAPTVNNPFSPIVLNGQVQTSVATLSNWVVTDATGSGNGWNVQVQASQFTENTPSSGFTTGTLALTLPQGSLSLTGSRTVLPQSGSTPISSTGGPNIAVTNPAIDLSSPVIFLTAQSGYGMGTYTVQEPTQGLSLVLNPSTTKVDQTNYPGQPTPFTSVITFTVVTGP